MTTILAPGDIAIVGYITNGTPDSFAFVNLVPLEAGTTLYFTDNGWTGTGFRNVTATAGSGSEGLIRFVADAAIAAGTIIRSSDTSSNFTWTTSGAIAAGTGSYTLIDLATAGDQITVVQSTNPNNPLLSGYTAITQIDNTGTFENATTSNEGNVAPGLSQASDTAILLNNTASRFASFNTSSLPSGGTRDQWLDAINNPTNWTFAASGTLPTGTLTVRSAQFGVLASTQKIASGTTNLGALENFNYFGSSVAGVGDLDNDGVEDIVVGARQDGTGGTNRGAVHVVYLNANGSVKSSTKIASGTANLGALANDDNFGSSVAGIGDLDNDGVEDIVVGARQDDTGGGNRGAAYVLLMNANGSVKSSLKIASGTTNFTTLANDDNFGSGVAGIGDLDNDGVEDIVVGALGDDTGGSNRGAAYVIYLNANNTIKSFVKIASDTTNLGTLTNGDNFGNSVAGIGDLDNDGVEDIAVGAPGDDTGGSNSNRGAVYVLLMNANGSIKASRKIASGTANLGTLANGDNFGSSISAAGDLNNDGIEDIIVGADRDDTGGTDRGAAYVIYLNSDGTVQSSQKIASGTTNLGTLADFDYFGSSVTAVGDLNNDGFADLAVGAWGDDTGGSARGATYILFGGSSNTAPTTANSSITVNEDTVYTFSSSNFPFTDPDAGNTLQRVRITQLPSAGQLFVDANSNDTQDAGEAVAVNQEIAVANLGQIKFAPAANANGSAYASFQFQVSDGTAFSAAAATLTINVTAVNDAPVLDNSGDMSLTAIAEDITAVLNSGTTVADLIASAGGDRITDVDAGALEGIAVTAVNNTNGTWQYSIDGTNWSDFGTPSESAARLLQSDARIRFVPNPNYNGTVSNGISFRAWDRTSGSNGDTANISSSGSTTAFSTAVETAAITVTAVDDTEFVVTNTNDSGVGSLRWAIELANADPGAETIRFNIPTTDPNYDVTTGTFRIRPTSALPVLTGQVILDGYSQPGASANTLETGNNAVLRIVLDGSGTTGSGLVLADGADGSTIQGLVIQRFTQNGILVQSGSDGNTIRGNFIGTNAAGTQDLGNAQQGIRIESASNTIGGNTAGDRNVISGNNQAGIWILGSGATSNQVRGNYIGTNAAGNADLGNTFSGIVNFAPNSIIGGNTAGDRNIISGNDEAGIYINEVYATGNQIRGNYIGTDVTGTQDLGNTLDGLNIRTANNVIGGSTAGDRNVISGNNGRGIFLEGSGATGNQVRGNYIGTDATGTADLGNTVNGIQIGTGSAVGGVDASSNVIGGTTAGDRNIISGNDASGIFIAPGSTGNQVQGNYIGTDVTGTRAIANSGFAGIRIRDTSNNQIGGTAAGAGNLIAFNTNEGVHVVRTTGTTTGNAIQGNQFHSNGGLAIDLNDDGVTLNDAGDGDTGVNTLQNFPVLTNVSGDTITGFLDSTPNTTFRIEFFSSAAYDPSGAGEGETFLGFVDVTTDASGTASINFTSPTAIGTRVITATATDPNGNTSEFSRRNQTPTNTLPTTTTIDEDTSVVFSSANGNAITISDGDGSSNVQVTLTATDGTLTLGSTSNVSVTGDGSGTVIVTGSVADLNAALNGLRFNPTANFNGNTSIQVVTNDNAPVQLGGALTDTDTLNITVNSVNDPATISGNATAGITEDVAVDGNGNLTATGNLTVSDVDAGEDQFSTTVTPAQGNLGSLTMTTAGAYTYTIANSAVQSLGAGQTRTETFTVTSADGTDTQDITITITGANDPATITGTATAGVTEDVAVDGNGNLIATGNLTVSDVDAGEDQFSTTVTPAQGNLGSLTIAPNGRYSYTVANSAVQSLGAGQTRTETFTVTSADGTDTQDITITITGANDVPVLTGTPATLNNGSEDTAYNIATTDLLAGFTDADGNTLSVTNLTATNGTLTATANGWTFTPTANYNGPVTLNYTVSDGNGGNTPATQSFRLTPVNDLPTGNVVITGTAQENAVLTANTTAIQDVDGLRPFSYQWQVFDGTNWTNLAGATRATFTPDDPQVGRTLRVRVSYTDRAGTLESLTSVPTAAIANVNDAPTGVVTLVGVAQEGQTLLARVQDIQDADGLGPFSYQWQAWQGNAWTNIAGATQRFFIPDNTLAGTSVRVRVSYTDQHNTAERLFSASSQPIANINNAPVLNRPIADTVIAANTPFQMTLAADTFIDLDAGDRLSYSASLSNGGNLPAWLRFDPLTRSFSGTPTNLNVEVLELRVTATDLAGVSTSDSFTLQVGFSTVVFPTTVNTIWGTVGNDSDLVRGTDLNDRIHGFAGQDYIRGFAGADLLRGGAGDDLIDGGLGADVLIGGQGNDQLIGGLGADVFVLRANTGLDTVMDFQDGRDRIGLAGGLGFSNLLIRQGVGGTEIGVQGSTPSLFLSGIDASLVTANDFVIVPL